MLDSDFLEMGLLEGIDESLVHSLVFQLVCHYCDKSAWQKQHDHKRVWLTV